MPRTAQIVGAAQAPRPAIDPHALETALRRRADREAAALAAPGRGLRSDAAPAPAAAPAFSAEGARELRLRRTGLRPLVFQGRQLARAQCGEPDGPFRYLLNVFEESAGGYVLEIRFQRRDRAPEEPCADRFFVRRLESVDEMIALVRAYDAAEDVDCFDALALIEDDALATLDDEEIAERAERIDAEIAAARALFEQLRARLLGSRAAL
ncbi:MAG: hypothetical protein AAFR16_11110 [Pseudomonadota bacterium]